MMAAIETFLAIIPQQLKKGNVVELGDFGTFSLTVSSEGQALAEDVTARSITETRVVFTPGKRFKQLLDTVEFERGTISQQS